MLRRFPIWGRAHTLQSFFAKIQGQKKGFLLQSLTQRSSMYDAVQLLFGAEFYQLNKK